MRHLATRLQHDVSGLQCDVTGLHPSVGRVRRVAARVQSDVSAPPTPATGLRRDVETLRVAHEKPMPAEILVRHPQGRVTHIQARAQPPPSPFFNSAF